MRRQQGCVQPQLGSQYGARRGYHVWLHLRRCCRVQVMQWSHSPQLKQERSLQPKQNNECRKPLLHESLHPESLQGEESYPQPVGAPESKNAAWVTADVPGCCQ